jgi:hypothetical protein
MILAVDLQQALDTFDRVETNLGRLEQIWKDLQVLVPSGIDFSHDSPEQMKYAELALAFGEVAEGLPPIAGATVDARPLDLEHIARHRMEASEISEPEIEINLNREMQEPGDQMAAYRHRFTKQRRELVRKRVEQLLGGVDRITADAALQDIPEAQIMTGEADWIELSSAITEIQRLLGNDLIKKGRWADLSRHLSFAKGVDLTDISIADWPSVRPDIEAALYSELEPLPVAATDLAEITAAEPSGPVSTKLDWSNLDAEEFERLLFTLFESTECYQNPKWLQKTNAPDRGRDLSVERVHRDPLTGVRTERVVVQCKHWLKNSIGPEDCTESLSRVELWDPPFDILILATSGRFTGDAVQWIEAHNKKGQRPQIEMWPETHLESLLANRTPLVTKFGLRSRD